MLCFVERFNRNGIVHESKMGVFAKPYMCDDEPTNLLDIEKE